MPSLLPELDPDGLLEYSVVFTDRSLNHMSQRFQQAMRDISTTLRQVYNGSAVALVPGGGTYAMESVARQFATGRSTLVVRNGFFSYRWSQIFDAGAIPASSSVLKARRNGDGAQAAFAPPPIAEVVAAIRQEKPAVVFAPHVETASGIILPDDYLRTLAAAVHEVGGLFVLDCIASGCIWVDMQDCGVDVLISAPQKGWSSSPSAGLVLFSERALAAMQDTRSTSFALDLDKWLQIMRAYENGGHAYHATMPTDALLRFRDTMQECEKLGFAALKEQQWQLGQSVRALFSQHGYHSVAATGFEAPGVAVFHADSDVLKSGSPFQAQGLQVAAGVPLMCDEGEDYRSFRIGLFGLDKLQNVPRSVASLDQVLSTIAS